MNAACQSNPDDAEWRMYEKCLPEERLACLIYEYARESEFARQWIAAVRSGNEALAQRRLELADALKEVAKQVASEAARHGGTFWAVNNQTHFLVECGDHFPDKSWLQIPADKRKQLADRLCLRSEVAKWTSQGKKPLPLLTEHGDPPLTMTPLKGLAPGIREVHSHAVAIDWSLSNERLLAQFELWLLKHSPSDRQIKGGKGSTTARDLLKSLAAKRLTEGCGQTANEAANFTQDKLGEPLYSNEETWSRQKKKALQFRQLTFGDSF